MGSKFQLFLNGLKANLPQMAAVASKWLLQLGLPLKQVVAHICLGTIELMKTMNIITSLFGMRCSLEYQNAGENCNEFWRNTTQKRKLMKTMNITSVKAWINLGKFGRGYVILEQGMADRISEHSIRYIKIL